MTNRTLKNSAEFVEWCKSHFQLVESSMNGESEAPFHQTRREALARFADLGVPSTRDEEWKYTNLAPILKQDFAIVQQHKSLKKEDLQDFVFAGLEDRTLVFVNGVFSQELSTFDFSSEQIQIASLREALEKGDAAAEKFIAKQAKFENHPFVALNTAFTLDGAFIQIPDNVELSKPLHILQVAVAGAEAFITHPRMLVVAGKNSQGHIIESFHAVGDGVYLSNAVTEYVVGANANIEHVKVQKEHESAFHIATTEAHLARDAHFTSSNVDLGAAIARNDLNIVLNDENCVANLYGFFLATGKQLVDNHTFIDHAMPHCESNELYKGILDDRARGVFNGKVMVRKDAQKTNAYQDNKCLLLTNDATMNAKPQLEIFADDVKCSHGATVGQLEEDALFYLRSRGIGEESANSLLRYAFASDVFEKIAVDEVRTRLEKEIFAHFGNE